MPLRKQNVDDTRRRRVASPPARTQKSSRKGQRTQDKPSQGFYKGLMGFRDAFSGVLGLDSQKMQGSVAETRTKTDSCSKKVSYRAV